MNKITKSIKPKWLLKKKKRRLTNPFQYQESDTVIFSKRVFPVL